MGRPNFGHIQRLGHNHYRIFWGKGYKPNGKRDRHTATIHGTREEAEILLAQKVGTRYSTQGMTWGRFWKVYVEPTFEGLAIRTVNDYRKLYSCHLEPHIYNVKVSETDEVLVDTVLAFVSSPTTQRHVKDLWRKMCRLAVRRKLLTYCPITADTPLKPMRSHKKRLLDATEVSTWLKGIKGFKHELVLLIMLGGGLRPEEAYGLHFEDISQISVGRKKYALVSVSRALTYSNGKVLKDTKNGFSEREVIIGQPFAKRILQFKGTGVIADSGKIGEVEQYSSPNTICNNYRAWCKRKGTLYIPPKNLRPSYSTMHAEAGSLDSIVSGSMGHSDGTTKGKYYQSITRRSLMMIADNLEEFLKSF